MKKAINWFELPATNFERAKTFYSAVLAAELQVVKMQNDEMAFFPHEGEGSTGGAIVTGPNIAAPSAVGSLIYLNGGDDLATPLARVKAAGGSVVMPKTQIGENGFIALFMDTEGNRVGLHSVN